MMPNFPYLRFDADAGIVYGVRGNPVIKRIRGYVYYVNSKRKISVLAHRLIWESVHGPIPPGLQINHINGIKHDNRIANLEVVTQKENNLHAYRIGLKSAIGEKNGRAKLNANDVREIRSSSLSARKLAEMYGMSIWTIKDITRGRLWKHVPREAAKGEV